MKKLKRIKCFCKQCKNEFEKTESSLQVFCSRDCKNDFQRGKTFENIYGEIKASEIKIKISNATQGENNPNFGNKWTDTQKEISSKRIKSIWEERGEEWRRTNLGKSNRGKTRSQEFIKHWHSNNLNLSGFRHSKDSKMIIGIKSKEKFSEEYKQNFRLKMEENGKWVPLIELSDWEIYKRKTNWIEKMWDKIILPSDFNEVGIFNSKTNRLGYTRDHIFSKRCGFKIGLFPEILRHPVNCRCLKHSINSSKNSKSDICIDELFNNIKKFNGYWDEHNECLIKIKLFEDGLRWERDYD